MRIVVCDDENIPRKDWVDGIRRILPDATIEQIGKDNADDLKQLVRRRFALANPASAHEPPRTTMIDAADVLVVDYDLTVIEQDARHTGEELARLARLHTDCGYVIVMNQFPRVGFDLTLRGHLESYADVNIAAELVGQPHLWSKAVAGDFRPWHWDDIAALVGTRRELAAMILERGFDTPVVELLEMPDSAFDRLSDTAFAFLTPSAVGRDEAKTTTLRSVLLNQNEHKDIERVLAVAPERAASAAVSRLGKWVARSLLGPQDVLVDVPHLLSRMPYLASRKHAPPRTTEDWNALVLMGLSALDERVVEAGRFGSSMKWIGKETLWWSEIENNDAIDELREAFDFEELSDDVFAEDASAFVPFEEAKEFRAGFHNTYDRRYVVGRFQDVNYVPQRRFAFQDFDRDAF